MELSQLYHNTRPEGELLPQEAAAVGIDYPALCQRIIDASLEVRKESL